MPRGLSLAGDKFNMLTVLAKSGRQIDGNVRWDCICDCGKTAWVVGSRLKSGATKSCGCLALTNSNLNKGAVLHGMSRTPEYQAWSDAKLRCNDAEDTQYEYYGGRGISMQASWLSSFQDFYNHIGPRPSNLHSLDRIDNDLDYCEGNIRWATKLEQVANRGRNTNNKTGTTGVSLVTDCKNGFQHYKASWGPKDNLTRKSFSVNKYGKDTALAMAVKARLDGLEFLKETSGYSEKHGEERQTK